MKKLLALMFVVVFVFMLTGCNESKMKQNEETYVLRYVDDDEYNFRCIVILGFKNDYDDNMDNTKDGIYPEEWEIKELIMQGSQTDIIIPDTIDSCNAIGIDGGAFNGCKSIISITFPDTLLGIEDGAFDGCNPDLLIKGTENSSAIYYAKENQMKYEVIEK